MSWQEVLGLVVAALAGLNLLTLWRARRAESLHPPLGQFLIVEGTRLHYLRRGSGPPLVLLHGSDGFLQDWSMTILDRLARDYDTIAFDRPGHGYSDPPCREAATPQVQSRILRAAMYQLGIEKPL